MELALEKNSDLIKIYDDESETCKFIKRDKGVNRQLLTIEEMLAKFGLLKNKIKLLEKEKTNLVTVWRSMPQPKLIKAKKELFQMLEGEQQVILKAEELLKKTEKELLIFAPDDYLAQLYYSDFTDQLKSHLSKLHVTLLTEDSPKSLFFIKQLNWPQQNCRVVEAQDLPCFIISDKKELLVAFHDHAVANEAGDKKKFKTAALWTNYNAFVWTLQILFSKLLDTGRTIQET